MRGVPLHGPTVRGRLRADRGLLALSGVVVALTTALLAAVGPLTVSTADLAMADAVRDAAPGGAVVATQPPADFQGTRVRQPESAERFANVVDTSLAEVPEPLATVLREEVSSLTSPSLEVAGPGPNRYVRLAYLRTPDGAPEVKYTAGRAPRGTVDADATVQLDFDAPPWPVQVALSEDAAAAIDVGPGDRLTLQDEYFQPVAVRVSGVYAAVDPGDPAWREAPELLRPAEGLADGVERISVAALVPDAALPDLRLAVPEQLTHRIVFVPRPEQVRWEETPTLRRQVRELQSSPGTTTGRTGWDSLLDRVLDDGLAQVSTVRGQGQVVQLGLLAAALLTLVLAAQLLAGRRAGSLRLSRERGASLPAVALELLPESVLGAVAGAGAGLGLTAALVGSPDWGAAVPVVAVAAVAPPVLGAVQAARATDVRRVPANRAARRAIERARRARRLVVEAAVVALAVLSYVALRQRGAVEDDLTTASATAWWAVAGALVLVRLLPPAVRLALRALRRGTGRVGLFVVARLAQPGRRVLAVLVVAVAVAQLVLTGALAATAQRGQEAGALLSVGGDARLTTAPDRALDDLADDVAGRPGVEEVVVARVEDGVQLASGTRAAGVRLVVVDAAAYRRLLATSDLPDAPQLGRLPHPRRTDGALPALVLGGPADPAAEVDVRWGEGESVPLAVVGEAPRVGATVDPVVVVDRDAFEAAGGGADPDTVWATGPGAAAALAAVAREAAGDRVTTYEEVVADRRDDPLTSALVDLALAAAVLLLLLAVLGVALGAAADAPARAVSVGRLRSLGLEARSLRRVLAAELLAPVAASGLIGLVLGSTCAFATFGSLGLELVTGQSVPPRVVVPWWAAVAVVILLGTALAVAVREARTVRRTSLAGLLRSGAAG